MNMESREKPEGTAKLPNQWQISGDHNPYVHNIFALLGIDPEEGDRALENKCRRADIQVNHGKTWTVHGHEVDPADVARARYLANQSEEYVAERLMAHTWHKLDMKRFQKPIQSINSLKFDAPADVLPLPIRDLSFVMGMLPQLGDVPAGEAKPLSLNQLEELAQPKPADEQIIDL